MTFIFENWFIIVIMAALIAFVGVMVWRFLMLPRAEQIEAVKEWLLGVVTEAEREFGGGTGRLKLRYVYDLFVARFPWLAKFVSFYTFMEWVDDALDEMRDMLATNTAVKDYVEGESAETVAKVGF